MKREQGATLIELIVALTVMGVLIGIGVPSFRNIRDVNRVKAAAEAVYAHLQFARSETIKQNRDLCVQVTPGNETYGANWCLGVSDDYDAGSSTCNTCDCMTSGSCVFGPTTVAQAERTLSWSNFEGIELWSNKPTIHFEPRRGMDRNAGTIKVKGAGGLTVSIVHSTRGRVRLCSDDDEDESEKKVRGYPSC